MLFKKCTKCNEIKELGSFYKHTTTPDRLHTECKLCFISRRKKYYQNNKNKEIKRMVLYNRTVNKLAGSLRTRLNCALKSKGWTKNNKFVEYIGCSLEELKKHLSSKFAEGMTWNNHGEWHIDHITPLSSARTEKEMYNLCHYTNLQPLWAKDNIAKGNKITRA